MGDVLLGEFCWAKTKIARPTLQGYFCLRPPTTLRPIYIYFPINICPYIYMSLYIHFPGRFCKVVLLFVWFVYFRHIYWFICMISICFAYLLRFTPKMMKSDEHESGKLGNQAVRARRSHTAVTRMISSELTDLSKRNTYIYIYIYIT